MRNYVFVEEKQMEFFAETNPLQDLCGHIAGLSPTNPFYTWSYAQAMQTLGFQPWVIGMRHNEEIVAASLAFMRSGRLNRSLEIISLPEYPDAPTFWEGLIGFCRKAHISYLEINTFASTSSAIPELPGDPWRADRWEYVLDLKCGDLFERLHANHKRRIKRAWKEQVQVITPTGASACEEHARMIAMSMKRRRDRGEDVSMSFDSKLFKALVSNGAGELFQAIRGGSLLSSIMVLKAKRGAYYQSGGSAAEGMECGASHLLHHEVSKILQNRNMEVYNLGGADKFDSGLAQFKLRFGARVIRLESGKFFLGSKVKRRLGTAARMIREDPLSFFRFLLGKVNRRLVYSALTTEIAYPEIIEGVEFRKLSDVELGTLPPTEELRMEQLERLQRMGFNGAYGVFYQGQLAHISWLITPNHESPRLLKLRKDEAEITASVTIPKLRGHGIYPFAIRNIAQRAASCGIQRIFMKTSPFNVASQRGIEKAGLRLQGQTLHFYSPYLPQATGLILRAYRRH